MEKLRDFENELNKCSKCALCQAVCPLYKLTFNDCVVSRGKFTMLHGVTKGDLTPSKNINKYLDTCLKCGKCTDFCPSSIDAVQIFNLAKYECVKNSFSYKITSILFSKHVFSVIINIFKFITKPFRPRKKRIDNPKQRIIYFKGCVNQLCPRTDHYLNKILKNQSVEIIEPNFECCGLPFLSEGNLPRFLQVAKHNTNLLNKDHDCIVCDCSSCSATLQDYPKYIDNIDFSNENFLNWGDVIANLNLKFKFKKHVTVTFHKPCHLKNDEFFNKIIENCENVDYIKMKDYDSCCGMAGSFAVKNTKLSNELIKQKAQNILNTNAQYVVSTCPVCLLGLKKGLFGKSIKVMSLLEFLSKAEISQF